MDGSEKKELIVYLRHKNPGLTGVALETLAELVEESLDLMEKYDYQWDRVTEAFTGEFGNDEGRQALRLLREHLSLYREFHNLNDRS